LAKPVHLCAFRLAFWEAFAKDLRGFGFWDYANCGGSVWDPWDVDRHDYAVVYDGAATELIPSKRWEAYRDGAEDHALLSLVSRTQSVGAHIEEVLKNQDSGTLADVRRQLMRAIHAPK
jgi:hypothetical protein